jgi:hypothetical protein
VREVSRVPRTAASIHVTDQDERTLRRWTRSRSIRAGLAQRARTVLAAAEGPSNTQIAEQVGCLRPALVRWRARYAAKGPVGLDDQLRPGRPRTVRRDRRAEILARMQSLRRSDWGSRTGPPAPSPASSG